MADDQGTSIDVSEYPKYLYLHCDECLRYVKIEELHSNIARDGPLEGKKVLIGKCRRCGEECIESFNSQAEIEAIARRSVKYFERARTKRNKRKKLVMAKKSKKRKKSKGEGDDEDKTTKAKKGSSKKSKSSKSSKSKKSSEGRTHESHWEKLTEEANGVSSLMMCIAGGPHTLEEAQARHDKLVKGKKIWRRVPPLSTTDFTWKQLDEVEIDGEKHTRLVGFNEDEEFVFSVPTLKDPLKKGSKKLKTRKKGGKIIVDGITMAISRKALKE